MWVQSNYRKTGWAWEVAQLLGAHIALEEDQGSVPTPTLGGSQRPATPVTGLHRYF